MTRKASEGIADLIDRTGGKAVEAKVTVDQPYAQDQHETLSYAHPHGGRAKYLEEPMYEGFRGWFQSFANGVLQGANAARGWADTGRSLAREVAVNAPVEFGDLRRSAGLEVREGGSVVVEDPALQPRMADQELLAKGHMRDLGVGYR